MTTNTMQQLSLLKRPQMGRDTRRRDSHCYESRATVGRARSYNKSSHRGDNWVLRLSAPVLSFHRRLASSHAALLNRAAWSVNPWSAATATNSSVPDERGAMDAPRAYSLAHHNVPYANGHWPRRSRDTQALARPDCDQCVWRSI